MNNQDFTHFDWGMHDHPDRPFYALVHPHQDRLYIIGEDYDALKLMQLIVLSSRHLILIRISDLKNYQPGLLDNTVCLGWSVVAPLGSELANGLAGTFRTRSVDLLSNHNRPAISTDLELQKNLFLIKKLLSATDGYIQSVLDTNVDLLHNQAMLDYFKIILPNDTQLIESVKVDQSLVLTLQNEILDCKNDLVKLLSNIDFSVDYETASTAVRNSINAYNFDSSYGIKEEFKQYILEKL